MKRILIFLALFILIVPLALAHGEDPFDEAKQLVDSKVSCDQLSDEQLEMIGDYLMEQMHPGEQHENIDNALGGEDSENLGQTHIRMARMMYCGEMSSMMGMQMIEMTQTQNKSLAEKRFFWFILGFIVALLISIAVIKFFGKNKKRKS